MTQESLKALAEAFQKKEELFFSTDCYRLERSLECRKGDKNVAVKYDNKKVSDGKITRFSALLNSDGGIVAAVNGVVLLELDGMELIEAAFNCHITRGRPEGQSCIFVDDSLKGYDYVLVNFEELFPHGHIYPFYKFKDGKALHEYMQLYHEIIDSTKTDEYSNFRHYNNLPRNTRGIKVPFSIKARDSHLTATPIVYHPLNECMCPLPTLLGADYGTHILGAAGKIRSMNSQIDDVIQDWRYIEAKSGSMIAGDNWLDFISFITKTQAYTELSKTIPK